MKGYTRRIKAYRDNVLKDSHSYGIRSTAFLKMTYAVTAVQPVDHGFFHD